jgi:hypothetical protein
MNDPATAVTWQTAFGKDFGGMPQGDNKTGQKGTNAMFVTTHHKIRHVLQQGEKLRKATQSSITVPQKKTRIKYESLQEVAWSNTTQAQQ